MLETKNTREVRESKLIHIICPKGHFLSVFLEQRQAYCNCCGITYDREQLREELSDRYN